MIDTRASYQIVTGTRSALCACACTVALPAAQEMIGWGGKKEERECAALEAYDKVNGIVCHQCRTGPHHKDATKRQVLRVAVGGDGEAGVRGGENGVEENRGLTVVTSSA